MTTYETIALEVAEGIATVTLDRPERLNAYTQTVIEELVDAWDRIDADDEARCVIVTGRGRAFCAGADLAEGRDSFVLLPAAHLRHKQGLRMGLHRADLRSRGGSLGGISSGMPDFYRRWGSERAGFDPVPEVPRNDLNGRLRER